MSEETNAIPEILPIEVSKEIIAKALKKLFDGTSCNVNYNSETGDVSINVTYPQEEDKRLELHNLAVKVQSTINDRYKKED